VTCRWIGVDAFELLEPAVLRDEAATSADGQRATGTGVGPDAADSAAAAAHHPATTNHDALSVGVIVRIMHAGDVTLQ
jgi:hypothetical protein